MKTTTTLYEIIHSELINNGQSEFKNKHQLVFYDRDFAFIKRMMDYDDEVKEIVNNMFFQNVKLNNDSSDDMFKKTFVNRFYNREIGFQTVEAFSSQVVFNLLAKYDYINSLYDELEDYIQGKYISEDNETNKELSDNRYLSSDLPQNEINLNVDDTVLNYGNQNSISRTKNEKEGHQDHTNRQYDLENLIMSSTLIEDVFVDFDRKCFLQVW